MASNRNSVEFSRGLAFMGELLVLGGVDFPSIFVPFLKLTTNAAEHKPRPPKGKVFVSQPHGFEG